MEVDGPPVNTFYTGVGNRKAPREGLELCREVGRELALRGLTLRTGDAKGADFAFLSGCTDGTDELDGYPTALLRRAAEVYRPTDDIPSWAFELAARVVGHKAWLKATENTRRLFARDAMQVLGRTGNSPSRFLLCWSRNVDPRMQDGTRVAARIADDYQNCRSTMLDGVVDVAYAGNMEIVPWLNLKGLALCDALAFAHQHAGVPVLRPGDLLPSRLVPEGSMIVRGGSVFTVYFDGGMRIVKNPRGEWRGWDDFPGTPAGRDPGYPDDVPAELVALGLTQETATADNLRRLAQEYEERKTA